MTKKILLIRHAKAQPTTPYTSDFDRPLHPQGERDAQQLGILLKKQNILPDAIIASAALRTQQTATLIAQAVGFAPEHIQLHATIYNSSADVLQHIIRTLPPEIKTVYIIAHNPGITNFSNSLSPHFRIDQMPTACVVGARLNGMDWRDFDAAEKELFLLEYPKPL